MENLVQIQRGRDERERRGTSIFWQYYKIDIAKFLYFPEETNAMSWIIF